MSCGHRPLQVFATTSDTESDIISFQYTWPLKVCQRLLENSEAVVLNVSPAFSTSYNGVQFTWALRLSDECVVVSSAEAAPSVRHVFVLLYYKDGPSSDVIVEEVRAFTSCPDAEHFSDLQIGRKEFTKGSGWPVHMERSKQTSFTEFVHKHIDQHINIVVDIKLKASLFEPFNYLPDVESACRSQRIENTCLRFIDDVHNKTVDIPNLDLLEAQDDKFSMHRLIFLYGCDLVERDCFNEQEDQTEHNLNLVRSTFAHVYFEQVLMKEVDFFEDFVALLEGVNNAHIPPLRREMERFICREVMSESADSVFTKKMLLLSERFSLDVLKMVATGVLVDQIIAHSDPPKELVSITHELKQIASEINGSLTDSKSPGEESLVGSVVEDLQSLTRRVRRVSLSHSPSASSQSSSPSATPTDIATLSPAVSDQRPFDPPNQGRFKRVELV